MNNIKKTNKVENDIDPNFLDQLSNHRHFKIIFKIKAVKVVSELPITKKVFDHKITRKFMNREMIMYLIFGVLATIVNIGTFAFMRNVIKMDLNIANFIAICCSIIFAYFTNKIWVFRSKTNNNSELKAEFLKFVSARSLTAILELLGVPFLVKSLYSPEMLAKVLLTIVVIATNYVLSKKAIFNKK